MQDAVSLLPNPVPRPGVPIVRAVERAATIVHVFTQDRPNLPLAEIARRAELDKGTTRRLLHTLHQIGWVEFCEKTQTYALGPVLLTLIPAVDFGRELRDVATPVLTRLSNATHATSFLWILFRGKAMCLERIRAHDLQLDITWSHIGHRVDVHCAGGPRILMAYMPDSLRREILGQPLQALTPFSQTDPRILEEEARQIRERGWELAVDDYVVGLSGLGAPVFNRSGEFAASISISTLKSRLALRKDGVPPHLDELLDAAAEIGSKLVS
jgi:DNA-binding IclR family transcriptional regulator